MKATDYKKGATFLQIPYLYGPRFVCTPELFRRTCESRCVAMLELLYWDSDQSMNEKIRQLKVNQPLFAFCRTKKDSKIVWNGMILFAVDDIRASRPCLDRYAEEMNAVMSFTELDTDRLFFLVDTGLRPETMPEEPVAAGEMLINSRKEACQTVGQYFSHPRYFGPDFLCCAHVIDHYTFYKPEVLSLSPMLPEDGAGNGAKGADAPGGEKKKVSYLAMIRNAIKKFT